jgi:hypothetical protein
MIELIELTSNNQLPKEACHTYRAPSLEAAIAFHKSKGRPDPKVIYHLKREYYIPAVRA